MPTTDPPGDHSDRHRIDLERYCAYRERSRWEVEQKIGKYGLRSDERDKLITHLVANGFLNEERFARSFARGKFRFNKWGRYKIRQALRSKHVPEEYIVAGLREINEEEYLKTLRYLIARKAATVRNKDPFTRNRKITDYMLRKGYELELIRGIIDS